MALKRVCDICQLDHQVTRIYTTPHHDQTSEHEICPYCAKKILLKLLDIERIETPHHHQLSQKVDSIINELKQYPLTNDLHKYYI